MKRSTKNGWRVSRELGAIQVEQVSSLDNLSNEELQSELDRIFEQEYGLTQDQLKKAVKGQHH